MLEPFFCKFSVFKEKKTALPDITAHPKKNKKVTKLTLANEMRKKKRILINITHNNFVLFFPCFVVKLLHETNALGSPSLALGKCTSNW